MSINLRHGESPAGEYNLGAVAAVINEARPDIVAIQEVDRGVRRSGGRDMPRELAEATGMYPAFGITLDQYQGGSYGLLMLSRVPYTVVREHLLPHQESREPRMIQEAFVTLESGITLLVFSTHLGYDDPSALRDQRFELLRARVGEHDFDIAILIGDLNAGQRSASTTHFWDHSSTPPRQIPAAHILPQCLSRSSITSCMNQMRKYRLPDSRSSGSQWYPTIFQSGQSLRSALTALSIDCSGPLLTGHPLNRRSFFHDHILPFESLSSSNIFRCRCSVVHPEQTRKASTSFSFQCHLL